MNIIEFLLIMVFGPPVLMTLLVVFDNLIYLNFVENSATFIKK